ncbi:hypothetical protein [Ferrimonas senticii]|uniref:hypothetical protein n=1 Tax=Ferrimonas senticii TaxID=394566 RepID=UPI0003F92609|nr:hypothetical protein [Ferrimonas senticii]
MKLDLLGLYGFTTTAVERRRKQAALATKPERAQVLTALLGWLLCVPMLATMGFYHVDPVLGLQQGDTSWWQLAWLYYGFTSVLVFGQALLLFGISRFKPQQPSWSSWLTGVASAFCSGGYGLVLALFLQLFIGLFGTDANATEARSWLEFCGMMVQVFGLMFLASFVAGIATLVKELQLVNNLLLGWGVAILALLTPLALIGLLA